MGNNQNTKNAEDIKLSNNDINILNKNWQEMLNQGLDILGVGLMTRIMIEHKEMKSMFRKRSTVGSDINENGEIINPNQVVKKHGEKVFNVIQTAMNSLDDLSKIYSDLNKIGYDHYQYGTRVEHFQIIGEALISTLSDALREKFKDDAKKAWIKIFRIIEFQMKQGMTKAEAEL